MRTHTFSYVVTLSDKEFAVLEQISKHVFCYNYVGPEGQLKLCDKLRDKGLLSEDGNGRVSLTHRGVIFLLESELDR